MAVGGGGGGGGAVRAGRAFVEFFLDDGKLQRGLGQLRGKFSGLSKSLAIGGGALTGAGGGVLAGLGKLVGDAVSSDMAVGKLASKLGIGAEKLSRFAFAASQTGVSLDDLEGHWENLAERIVQGAAGSGEAAATFKKLGIDAQALGQLDQADQLIALSEAMTGVTNETERLGILSSLGGDKFQQLNDLFRQGPAAIRAYMADADKFGAVVTDEQVAAAKELNTAWTNSTTAIKSVLLEVGRAFFGQAGNASTLTEQVALAATTARDFIRENKAIIVGVAAAAAGVTAAGVALLGLSGIFAGLSLATGAAATVLGFLFSPAGLLVAGVAAAVVALFAFTDAWGFLKDTFSETANTFNATWAGISDALQAGDLTAAVRVLTAGVELEWARFMLKLQDLWNDFKSFFVDGWHDAVYLVKQTLIGLQTDLAKSIVSALATASRTLGPIMEAAGLDDPLKLFAEEEGSMRRIIDQEGKREAADHHKQFQAEQAVRDAARAADAQAARDRLGMAKEEFAAAVEAARVAAFMKDVLFNNATAAAAAAGRATKGAPTTLVTAGGAFGAQVGGRQFGRSGDDLQRKQLAEQEKIAKNTEAVVDAVKGLAFVWGV